MAAAGVRVTTNGGADLSASAAKFLFRPAPEVLAVDPPRGTAGSAGTVVTVTGRHFLAPREPGELLCRFGDGAANHTLVPGALVGPGTVECPAPPLPPGFEVQRVVLAAVAQPLPEVQVVEVSALPGNHPLDRHHDALEVRPRPAELGQASVPRRC